MTQEELKDFLDFKASFYEKTAFIQDDPIQIPHQFVKKEDIEIISFLISTIAWGNRKSIINSGEKLIQLMDFQPYEFVMNFSAKDLKFVHRTFNQNDLNFFLLALKEESKDF